MHSGHTQSCALMPPRKGVGPGRGMVRGARTSHPINVRCVPTLLHPTPTRGQTHSVAIHTPPSHIKHVIRRQAGVRMAKHVLGHPAWGG